MLNPLPLEKLKAIYDVPDDSKGFKLQVKGGDWLDDEVVKYIDLNL